MYNKINMVNISYEVNIVSNALEKISYGLFVLTAKNGDADNGCIINTVIQATVTPQKVVFAVNKANFTHELLLKNPLFTV